MNPTIWSNSFISTCLGNLEMFNLKDHKNEQLLNFHIITTQIPICIDPKRFQKSYNVEYFKVIKHFKTLQKADAYLEPKRASMMKLFCGYT